MTPSTTTTEIITEIETFVTDNAPQMFLILLAVLGAVFIWALGKRGLKRVFGFFTRI